MAVKGHIEKKITDAKRAQENKACKMFQNTFHLNFKWHLLQLFNPVMGSCLNH